MKAVELMGTLAKIIEKNPKAERFHFLIERYRV